MPGRPFKPCGLNRTRRNLNVGYAAPSNQAECPRRHYAWPRLMAEAVHIMLERVFGPTISLSTGRVIPTRWVDERHVQQDLGFIPSFADWIRANRPLPWMGRTGRLEDRPHPRSNATRRQRRAARSVLIRPQLPAGPRE
jgi:hypothetical protein